MPNPEECSIAGTFACFFLLAPQMTITTEIGTANNMETTKCTHETVGAPIDNKTATAVPPPPLRHRRTATASPPPPHRHSHIATATPQPQHHSRTVMSNVECCQTVKPSTLANHQTIKPSNCVKTVSNCVKLSKYQTGKISSCQTVKMCQTVKLC